MDRELQTLDDIASTARKVYETINKDDNANDSSASSMEDHFAHSVDCALKQILTEYQFRCMAKIMEILDIYNRGKGVNINEID